jgi:hypothetical protein
MVGVGLDVALGIVRFLFTRHSITQLSQAAGMAMGRGEIFLFCRASPLILTLACKPCSACGAEAAGAYGSDEERAE